MPHQICEGDEFDQSVNRKTQGGTSHGQDAKHCGTRGPTEHVASVAGAQRTGFIAPLMHTQALEGLCMPSSSSTSSEREMSTAWMEVRARTAVVRHDAEGRAALLVLHGVALGGLPHVPVHIQQLA